jgi:hypothetical protein
MEAAGPVEHPVENVAVAAGGDEGLLRAKKARSCPTVGRVKGNDARIALTSSAFVGSAMSSRNARALLSEPKQVKTMTPHHCHGAYIAAASSAYGISRRLARYTEEPQLS